MVKVMVVPLSDELEIGLLLVEQTDGRPLAHDATPDAHPGIELIAVKVSVAGLYISAVQRHLTRRRGRRRRGAQE